MARSTRQRRRLVARTGRRLLPAGYGLSASGIAIIAIGGPGDLVWHTVFGIMAELSLLVAS